MEQREGRDEDVGEVVDDQVEQHPVKARGVGFDVIFPRERSVDAVDRKGDNEPEEHDRPLALRRSKQGQHGKDSAGGR